MSWIEAMANPQARQWEEFYRNRWQHGFLPRRVAWIEFAVLLVLPPAIGFLHLHKNVDQTPDSIQMEPHTLAG